MGKSLNTLAEDMRFKTFAQISFYDLTGQMIYSTLPFPHNLTPELAAHTIYSKDLQQHDSRSFKTRDLRSGRHSIYRNSRFLGSSRGASNWCFGSCVKQQCSGGDVYDFAPAHFLADRGHAFSDYSRRNQPGKSHNPSSVKIWYVPHNK